VENSASPLFPAGTIFIGPVLSGRLKISTYMMNRHILVLSVAFVVIAATFPVVRAATKDYQIQYEEKSSVSKKENVRSRDYPRRRARFLKKEGAAQYEQTTGT
jgi:hypothetical protein